MNVVNIIGAFILALGLVLLIIMGFCCYISLIIESVKDKDWIGLTILIGGALIFLGIILFLA